MYRKVLALIWLAASILILASLACSFGEAVTSTASPTNTLPPPTNTSLPPTNTPMPTNTNTPEPTATPNVAATKQVESLQLKLDSFKAKGLIDSTEGTIKVLPDFKKAIADKGKLDSFFDTGETLTDFFVFSAHFKWSSAISTADVSGCGVGFGYQDKVEKNGDHYVVYLDRGIILFLLKRNLYYYRVGRTNGPKGPTAGTPLDHDFALLVKAQKVYVWVDGVTTTYTLSIDQTAAGGFAVGLLSGTNKDYGTRCEMTNVTLWEPK